MTDIPDTSWDRDTGLEDFAAELTRAVYPLLLGHGLKDSWLEVELSLWGALGGTVKKWARRRPAASSADELEAWREGLLGDLTGSAFSIAVNSSINGPRSVMESCLYLAFRHVIGRYSHVN